MKSNTHKIKTISVLWFRLYLHHIKQVCADPIFRIGIASILAFSAGSRYRGIETDPNSILWEREREREVCARTGSGQQDLVLTRQYRQFSETAFLKGKRSVLGTFLKGKKSLKGATLCISISPTTGWATGQTENTCCVNRALIKWVPIKLICINELTLTALINTYI